MQTLAREFVLPATAAEHIRAAEQAMQGREFARAAALARDAASAAPQHPISSSQAREPLRQDTARAAKYGALLDLLRTALGLAPYSTHG